jgi:cell division protease FtsH
MWEVSEQPKSTSFQGDADEHTDRAQLTGDIAKPRRKGLARFLRPEPPAPGSRSPKRPQLWKVLIIGGLAAVAIGMSILLPAAEQPPEEVPLDEALTLIEDGEVASAELNDDARILTLTLDDDTKVVSGYPTFYGVELVDTLVDAGVEFEVGARAVEPVWQRLLLGLMPIILLGSLMVFIMSRYTGGRLSAGDPRRSKAVDTPEVTLADVVGAPEAVEDLRDVVEFLRDPERFSRLGAVTPRGVLLVGPPGTGKTLLARAVAGEAHAAFFSLSGSDFVEMFVGVGASRIRSAFDRARKEGPAIVFIDELDSIGKARGGGPSNGASDERESTLNALLVEMDGFHDSNVVVIAATNRPDTLDAALLRPGRFDRQVVVAAPDRKGRRELFRLYLQGISLDPALDVDDAIDRLARRSAGMTGANVKAICNEAALFAAKDGAPAVTLEHLEAALERGAMGRERRSAEVSDRARQVTAWHEAGHAVVAMVLPDAEFPERVSIVPRGPAGGVTWFGSPEDEHFITRSQCLAALAVAFGGRAGEEVVLDGDYTQGAVSDIAAATDRAEKMVCEWGMSALGPVRIDPQRLFGADGDAVRSEVSGLLDAAMDTARATLAEHDELFAAVAAALLEDETIGRDELERLAERHLAPSAR